MQGDLGKTLRNKPVWPDLRDAIIVTIQLGSLAFLITIVFGLSIGVISAIKQYSWFDTVATGLSFFGLSIPPFFFGLMLQIILVLKFRDWFGDTPFYTSSDNNSTNSGLGYDRLIHLVLPALTVAVQGVAIYSRSRGHRCSTFSTRTSYGRHERRESPSSSSSSMRCATR